MLSLHFSTHAYIIVYMQNLSQIEMDKNLLVVTAVQGYAQNHHISENSAFKKFSKYNMFSLLRNEYDALHTQPLEETVDFAEDVIKRFEK